MAAAPFPVRFVSGRSVIFTIGGKAHHVVSIDGGGIPGLVPVTIVLRFIEAKMQVRAP